MKRRGNAIIEFCVGSGLLMAAFSGCFELGYTMLEYNRLVTAVAQGARYAAVIPYDSATASPSAAYVTAVQNMVLYGSPSAGSAPVVNGLTAGNIAVAVTFANGVPAAASVSISGYTVNALFRSHLLSGKPQATFPYVGVWAPV
jgi:Flp pilus assembly protein TadG